MWKDQWIPSIQMINRSQTSSLTHVVPVVHPPSQPGLIPLYGHGIFSNVPNEHSPNTGYNQRILIGSRCVIWIAPIDTKSPYWHNCENHKRNRIAHKLWNVILRINYTIPNIQRNLRLSESPLDLNRSPSSTTNTPTNKLISGMAIWHKYQLLSLIFILIPRGSSNDSRPYCDSSSYTVQKYYSVEPERSLPTEQLTSWNNTDRFDNKSLISDTSHLTLVLIWLTLKLYLCFRQPWYHWPH